MQPAAQPVLRSLAFLMVTMSLPMVLLSSSFAGGAILVAGLALFGLTHKLGSSVRNQASGL